MNVIVANEQRDVLSNLDIDIIKSIYGEYDASEIVEMFKNFFYNRMILDASKEALSFCSTATLKWSFNADISKIILLK